MKTVQGLVNRIIPFSSVDGPGNRLVIFLQGCNLNCLNCHNPQTIGVCNYCGLCVAQCPSQALSIFGDVGSFWMNYDQEHCLKCDLCLRICPASSDPRSTWMEIDEVIRVIRPVASFLSGITVSGGEATEQIDFVRGLFSVLKNDPELAFLSRFIDSNGMAEISLWKTVLHVVDGVIIDLKAFDTQVHRKLTGQDNHRVLASIPFLNTQGKLFEVRLLIIPEFNSSLEKITETAKFLARINSQIRIKLIAFRKHGIRQSPLSDLAEADIALLEEIKIVFEQYGFSEIILS